ncbi:hypothetical protein MST16_08975 [Acinetobacter sp. YH16040_T]|uniref:hypothetical protein n=1 Tax=unclassified Acinetobacter TaxID=196816 RepID=UPI0015D1D2D6|nr:MULTISPECIES: hypothetical protein [unclassified Acinetobacter]UUS56260.1 hypothetical protein MST16_08975 [Acinetobacter sp. YH16040_T]
MAKKNKLTLASVRKAAGVGVLVERTISFVGNDGEKFEGEILIKRLSHQERLEAIDAWGLEDKSKATVDQYSKAMLFAAVYSSEDEKFFSVIEDTGLVNSEIIASMSEAVEDVNDFMGKKWILNQKNSGASSSSTESAEEPLKKQNSE